MYRMYRMSAQHRTNLIRSFIRNFLAINRENWFCCFQVFCVKEIQPLLTKQNSSIQYFRQGVKSIFIPTSLFNFHTFLFTFFHQCTQHFSYHLLRIILAIATSNSTVIYACNLHFYHTPNSALTKSDTKTLI